MTIKPVTNDAQRVELRDALAAEDLPTEDLEDSQSLFLVARSERGMLGFIGVEGKGSDRLLRSAVVLPAARSSGVGAELVRGLEHKMREDGCKRLHLLTTTAAKFFAANGYAVSDRACAPDSIRQSREFSELCPASATYMVKSL